ncbi:MAG TPA: hypothetical protein VFP59_13970 [Candidatus Angelobacter sp.]|nr:hypothetical protein [Candidatus Angelobacter sp.]
MAANSGLTFNIASATAVLGTLTAVAVEVEKLIAAAGAGGSFNAQQVEQLTLLFGNLAGVVMQAIHLATGKELTPESVLALMPSSMALKDPVS